MTLLQNVLRKQKPSEESSTLSYQIVQTTCICTHLICYQRKCLFSCYNRDPSFSPHMLWIPSLFIFLGIFLYWIIPINTQICSPISHLKRPPLTLHTPATIFLFCSILKLSKSFKYMLSPFHYLLHLSNPVHSSFHFHHTTKLELCIWQFGDH